MTLPPPRLETRDLVRTFKKARAAEETYVRKLNTVAAGVEAIVKRYDPTTEAGLAAMQRALVDYSKLIEPWAKATANRMIAAVAAKNRADWAGATKGMSLALRQELERAPIGLTYAELIQEQVEAITSIPSDAAKRLFEMATGGLYTGVRGAEFAKAVLESGQVSRSTARMLGRTAVGIASSKLTQARAEHIESPGYIWRTAKDAQVRPSHRRMEGRYVEWARPPTLDGYTSHAGCFANCRCYPEVVIPELEAA